MTKGARIGRRQLQIVPWLLWLLVMLTGGYYRHYMAGWQVWLLLIALGILVLVWFADLLKVLERGWEGDQGTAARRGSPFWEVMLHLVPLAVFLAMGPSSVAALNGNLALQPRPAATTSKEVIPDDILPPPEQAPDGLSSQTGDKQHTFQRINLLKLYNELDHKGIFARQVEVEGRVHILSREDREEVRKRFGVSGVDVILYRYLIVCCAADAQPVFVVLKDVDPKGLGQDQQWMVVRGATAKLDGHSDFLTLAVSSMKRIKEPSQPYLLPWAN